MMQNQTTFSLWRGSIFVAQAAALWLALIVGMAVAAQLVPVKLPPLHDGPLPMAQAFLLVNGLVAVVLALLARRARVAGLKLALLVFVALFGIQTAVMQIETVYFNDSIKMPLAALSGLCIQAAMAALLVSLVAGLAFRPRSEALEPLPSALAWRLAGLAVVYVALYWSAGLFIAWQSPVVRAYYDNAAHIAFLPTLALQLFRGTLWALIALFVVRRLKGSLAERAAIMILLFLVLTTAQLIYPNAMVLWPVRQVHLIEVGVSEALYGLLATLILLVRAVTKPA